MKITLVVIGVISVLIATAFIYYGGLSKVNCRVEKQGGETLAYRQMTGDYAKSAKLMDEIYYSLLNDYGIETFKGFGIYYDNPKEVEKPSYALKSAVLLKKKTFQKLLISKKTCKLRPFPRNPIL